MIRKVEKGTYPQDIANEVLSLQFYYFTVQEFYQLLLLSYYIRRYTYIEIILKTRENPINIIKILFYSNSRYLIFRVLSGGIFNF